MKEQLNELFKYATYIFNLYLGVNKYFCITWDWAHTHTFCPSVLQILDGYWRQEGKRKLHNLPLFILILTLHLEKMKDNSDQCLFNSIASGTDNINFIGMP